MLCVLPGEKLEEEHVARDALGLQAQVLHLQLGHLGVDKNGKLPQPAGRGGGEVSQASPSGPAKFRLKGEGVICPSRTFPKDSGPHRAPPPWQPASPQKEGELRPCQITNRWRVSRLAPDCRHASTFSPSLCPEPILRANGPTLR